MGGSFGTPTCYLSLPDNIDIKYWFKIFYKGQAELTMGRAFCANTNHGSGNVV
jgi:hypothetical protein